MSDEVLDIFREEAREHLSALEKSFLDLETAGTVESRRDLIDNAFRHAHSLKSDAKVVGLPELKQAAQELEDILDQLRDDPESVDKPAIDRGLSQFDRVRGSYENWQGAGLPEAAGSGPADGGGEAPAEPPSPAATLAPAEEASRRAAAAASEERFTVRVPSERLDRMLSLAGELRISRRAAESVATGLGELDEQLAGILAAAMKCDRKVREAFDRWQQTAPSTEQADRSRAEVNDRLASIRRRLEAALDRLRRIDGDLRHGQGREALLVEALENDIRQARLLPLVMLTDSLRRTARDLAQSLGKPIAYHAEVGSIMLDKAVIESLKDPLQHMIRNAADHGIETADERKAAGKPEEGTIRIAASRRGPLVRITVADDGRGVDFSRIREHIAQAGEMDEAEIARFSQRELARRMFQAGFSTAAAGDVSGRGVGLDVVLDAVRRLQGSVELESSSTAGGATFAITVPVSVSTVRILTVLAGGQFYGIPSSAVIRTGRAGRDDLRELEGSLVLPVDGRPVRWVHLGELVGGRRTPRTANGRAWSYLLVSGDGQEMALAVDDLEEEQEVLLKPLGYPLAGLTGIVGATIRADGSVQLVLDVSDRAFARSEGARARPAVEEMATARILVVDDSPTTRAVLRNVFTAAGYAVATATDGVDALERLAAQAVDVVVSDVEMPRLGGFDLTRQVKSRFGLPVILVTGREREEHRREGLEAGADAFVVKSTFEDKGLLEIVEQFV